MISVHVKNFKTQKAKMISMEADHLKFLSPANKAILKSVPYKDCKAWINGHNDILNKINIFYNLSIFNKLKNEDEDFV